MIFKFKELTEKNADREYKLKVGYNSRIIVRQGGDFNMLVAGAAETGKSIFVDQLLIDLARAGYSDNILVLDPTGEHRVLKAFGFKVVRAGLDLKLNPLSLPFERSLELLSNLPVYVFGDTGAFTPIQMQVLYESLEDSTNLEELVEALNRRLSRRQGEDVLNAIAAVLRRIRPLTIPALMGADELPTGKVVIDLSYMPSEEAKNMFSVTALYMVYLQTLAGRWSGLTVVDEADRLGSGVGLSGRHILEMMVDELRKYGTCCCRNPSPAEWLFPS